MPVVRPLRTIGLPSPEARAPAVRLPEPSPEIVRPGPPAPAPPEAEPWSPPFLPHDLAPRLVNAEEVRARLHAAYPADLREAGVGGEALLWMLVGERGEPREVRLARSSGATALDSVAREVSAGMRFRPAFAGSRAVAVWIAQPIRFSVERAPREVAPPGR